MTVRLLPFLVAGAWLVCSSAARVAHADPARTVPLVTHAAAHDARVTGDQITWHSVYIDNSVDSQAWVDNSAMTLDLAVPLEATLDLAASPGVKPIVDGTRITSLVIDPHKLPVWSSVITVTFHAPFHPEGSILQAPLARGDVVQRIVLSGGDELRFEAREPGVERHVGYAAPPSSRESDRRECDARLGAFQPLSLDDVPLYLTGTDGLRDVHGHFSTGPERARAGIVAATILFVLIAFLLALAHARLSGRARIEQAEAVLREEYGGDWRTR